MFRSTTAARALLQAGVVLSALALVSTSFAQDAPAQPGQSNASADRPQAPPPPPVPNQQAAPGPPVQLEVNIEAPPCAGPCPSPVPPPPNAALPPVSYNYPRTHAPLQLKPHVLQLEHIKELAPPPGFVVRSQSRLGLVIAGSVVGGLSYLNSAVAGVAIDDGRGAPMAIPVIGPFVAMGTLGENGGARAGLMLAGLAQGAGLAMVVFGVAMPKTTLVRYETPNRDVSVEAKVYPGGVALSASF